MLLVLRISDICVCLIVGLKLLSFTFSLFMFSSDMFSCSIIDAVSLGHLPPSLSSFRRID